MVFNEYQIERQNEAKRLQELCKQIAFYLNSGETSQLWAYTVPEDEETALYPTQKIQHTKIPEAQISIRFETYGAGKGRVIVDGNYHLMLAGRLQFFDVREYGTDGREPFPKIGCGPAKTADAIAKDIKRRFLPEYMRLIHKAIARRDEYQKSTNQTIDILLTLGRRYLSQGHIEQLENRISERPEETKSFYLDQSRGEVSVSGNQVTLKLDVTMDQAQKILDFIFQSRG